MSKQLRRASAIAVAATLLTTVVVAGGSGAFAQSTGIAAIQSESAPTFIAQPVVQPLPSASAQSPSEGPTVTEAEVDSATVSAHSLAQLVAAQPQTDDLSRELNCLAGAIYFESKGETLPGQLAVGRVIVARSKSGRFPSSYCGVVYQRSQFSFVHGNAMPSISKNSRNWRNAVAIARIAHENTWQSPVEGALYFHASHVSPGWNLKRIAQVDNHVFYR